MLGRPADSGAFPIGRFQEGFTAFPGASARFIEQIENSPEFQARFSGLSNQEIITEHYNTLFGRSPESEGLAFFNDLLTNTPGLDAAGVGFLIAQFAEGSDARALENKQMAADIFSQSLDTPVENEAYKGEAGIQAGKEFLSKVTQAGDTRPTLFEAQEAIIDLAIGQGLITQSTSSFTSGNSGGFDYLGEDSVDDVGTPIIGVDFYTDDHSEFF